jgi:hypothetical protein
MWEPRPLTTLWAFTACYRDSFTFLLFMCLFCVCVVLCLGRGLATSWSLVQGVLPTVNDHETEKSEARVHGGCRASEKKIHCTLIIWYYQDMSLMFLHIFLILNCDCFSAIYSTCYSYFDPPFATVMSEPALYRLLHSTHQISCPFSLA